MKALSRRAVVLAASIMAVTACGAADDANPSEAGTDAAATNEMVLGDADAPVTVIEYASWTCPACLQFHNEVVGKMKEDYVETGKVKFIFREFPTAPANISVAGFAIARCAGEDQYFDVVDELFSRQNAILSVARQGGQVKSALQAVASNYGITSEEDFDACLSNSDIRKAIAASVGEGEEDGITGTPTVLVDGESLSGSDWRRYEGMQTVLNEALGEDAPAEESMPAETETDMTDDTAEASEDSEAAETEASDTESGEATPQ